VARTRARKSKAPTRPSKTSSPTNASTVVLVVEDEPTVRTLAASTLAEHGYATLSAANGTEALALLSNDDTPIDLLFTDINMPDGPDGLELALQAVELRPALRVVYTSGGGQTDGMIARFVDGATFLPKPYTNEQLVETVGMADRRAKTSQ